VQFAVIVVVLIGLTFIWRLETQVTGLKVGLSLTLLVATGAVIKKLKLDERGLSGGSSKRRSSSGYKPACSTCHGSRRKYCHACSGSGQGPGSLGNVLGKSVSSFHSSGTG